MTSWICKTLTRPLPFLSSRRRSNSVGSLVPCLSRFPALAALDISFCNLVEIPDAIGLLHCLEVLKIGGNNIVALPHCIKELPKLSKLHLEYSKHLKWLPSTFMPIAGTRGRDYYGGIYVFNCPNLSDTEGCRVTVISWMIKMIQMNPHSRIEGVVPGTKIPRWFSKQNTGSSIRLDPSPILDVNNLIGIAVCVTFVAHHASTQFVTHHASTQFVELEPELLRFCFCSNRRPGKHIYSLFPIQFKQDLITTELDHLLLMFFPREDMNSFCPRDSKGASYLDGTELAAETSYPEVVEVKSCGYHWVFKEDLEQFNPTMMYTANSSSHSQNHKFLAIQDDQLM